MIKIVENLEKRFQELKNHSQGAPYKVSSKNLKLKMWLKSKSSSNLSPRTAFQGFPLDISLYTD